MLTPNETVGTRLTEARTNAGLSTGQVARLMGVSKGFIEQCENGAIEVTGMFLLKLATTYDVSLEFLKLGTLREVEMPATTMPEEDQSKLKRLLGMMRQNDA